MRNNTQKGHVNATNTEYAVETINDIIVTKTATNGVVEINIAFAKIRQYTIFADIVIKSAIGMPDLYALLPITNTNKDLMDSIMSPRSMSLSKEDVLVNPPINSHNSSIELFVISKFE